MKHATAAEKRAIVNGDVAAEQTIIGDDDVVSYFTVVSDVRSGHEKILVADFGHTAFGAAAMDGAMLANDIVVSDRDVGLAFGGKGKVLRRGSDDCGVSNEVSRADRNIRLDHRVRLDYRFFTDNDVCSNHRIWPDRDVIPNLSRWIDNRR